MDETFNFDRSQTTPRSSTTRPPTIIESQAPIVWAIDAFPDEREVNLRTATTLRQLFSDAPVHPVYVLSEESFTDRGYTNALRPALKPMALKALTSILHETHSTSYRKPRVLVENSASRPACARKLMRYAERIGAQMILLGSHGRKGFSRFLVGSFSEAVINHSHLPVIISGPHIKFLNSKPEVIIFPTDFSPACLHALPDVIKLAQKFDAEIHFFHKEVQYVDPLIQSGVQVFGGGWVTVEPFMVPPEDTSKSAIQSWVLQAESEGVRAKFVGENFREPTSDAIVQYAKSIIASSPLVAMVSQTGLVASRLLGSVTRDVIRSSPCPVYLAGHPD
jgi:nucleotide-binding universal stress UspA family protein